MSDLDEASELYDEREFDESEYYQGAQNGTDHGNEVGGLDDDEDEDNEVEEEEEEDDEDGSDVVAPVPPPPVDPKVLNDFCNRLGSMIPQLRDRVVKMVQKSAIQPLEAAVLGAYLAVFKRDFVEQVQAKFGELLTHEIESAVKYFRSTDRGLVCRHCGNDLKLGLHSNGNDFIAICTVCGRDQNLNGDGGCVGVGITNHTPTIEEIESCLMKFYQKIRGMGYFYQEEMKEKIEDRYKFSYNLPVLPLRAHMAGAYFVMMEKSFAERIRLQKALPQLSERQVQDAINVFDPEAI